MAHGYLGKHRRPAMNRGKQRSVRDNPGQASSASHRQGLQGEGNYDAAREFDDAERAFVESGKLEEGIRNAPPRSETERREMELAEQQAKQRAKEEDPALLKKPPARRRDQR
ncbi:MAG TPA: hypothetical protein VL742_17255 [Casimicrobiaceae bacterium]|nr:hypothetical protein [Casimicrobiaceae bacterium]